MPNPTVLNLVNVYEHFSKGCIDKVCTVKNFDSML